MRARSGAQRAKDGHPTPFKLTYVEVGNEDPTGGRGGRVATYAQRFPIFYAVIKAKYPNIQVISTTRSNFGPYTPDVIDEHYYMDFNGALNSAHLYDNRQRTAATGSPVPKIFVGEWATRDNNPTPSFHAALTDAAFLTGLERNADLVIMSCYAPLFDNVSRLRGPDQSQQWATDLIGYDALTAFGSPSYYVQKMFYNNKGDVVLPISLTPQIAPAPATAAAPAAPGGGQGGFGGRRRSPATSSKTMFASSSLDQATGDIILKVVNAVPTAQQVEISLEGAADGRQDCQDGSAHRRPDGREQRRRADESRSEDLHHRGRRKVCPRVSGQYGHRHSVLDEMTDGGQRRLKSRAR